MKLKAEKTVLDNGLTVVTVPMETESVAAILGVRVGSRDETEKTNGLSHFMEHMVFKGTKKWPKPLDMNKVIESVGGVVNAFTSHELTGFWVKVAKKHLGLGLEYLHQQGFYPLVPKEELEKERGVIIEEINMRQDNPMSLVQVRFVSQIYSMTCLGWDVIGTKKNIKSLSRQDFVDHLSRWYQPKNMVLGVAGGVTQAEVVKAARKIFRETGKSEVKYSDRPELVKLEQVEPRVEVIEKKTEQANFCLGIRTLERGNKDRYGLGVLNVVLGGGMSSRLFNEIREKRGLVYYIRSSLDSFFETGHLMVQAGCDLKRVEEAIKVTKEELGKMKQKSLSVTDEELRRAKEYYKGRLVLSLEDSAQVGFWMTEDLLLENKNRTVEEIKQGVEAVTKDKVRQVAEFKDKGKFDQLIGLDR